MPSPRGSAFLRRNDGSSSGGIGLIAEDQGQPERRGAVALRPPVGVRGRPPRGAAGPSAGAVDLDALRGRGNLSGRRRSTSGPGTALRRVSRADVLPTEAFLADRLREASELRAEAGMGGERALRVLYSEGDFLPGMIADRYGDVLSVQILTAGMEIVRNLLLDVLERRFRPRLIYERSEGGGITTKAWRSGRGRFAGRADPGGDRDGRGPVFRGRGVGTEDGLFP